MSDNSTPEKEMTSRQKNTRMLHIQGLILMVILVIALYASVGLLVRTYIMNYALSTGLFSSGRDLLDVLNNEGMMGALTYDPMEGMEAFVTIYRVLSALGYIVAIGALAGAFVMLFLMRKRVKMILDDPTALENTINVSKAKYVWLGFLLGGYGAHLFALGKKKKGWIFLGLGLIGFTIPIAFLYTSGISFADAYLAAFIPKDSMGTIDLEDYPYWI